jgi:hypothetical protein
MAGSGESLGVAGAARSPQQYWWYMRMSGWRQARPDAVGNRQLQSREPLAWRVGGHPVDLHVPSRTIGRSSLAERGSGLKHEVHWRIGDIRR